MNAQRKFSGSALPWEDLPPTGGGNKTLMLPPFSRFVNSRFRQVCPRSYRCAMLAGMSIGDCSRDGAATQSAREPVWTDTDFAVWWMLHRDDLETSVGRVFTCFSGRNVRGILVGGGKLSSPKPTGWRGTPP